MDAKRFFEHEISNELVENRFWTGKQNLIPFLNEWIRNWILVFNDTKTGFKEMKQALPL